MTLPQDFLDRMKRMLGEEYPEFLASYENGRYQALRLNPKKTEKERFLAQVPFSLEPVPWERNGFYYDGCDQPGKHPYHEAGVYYIQEPSAMAPAAYLMDGMPVEELPDAENTPAGERVLDLCAAPGGKTTQIAAYMNGKGLLVCNEIHPARAKILSENVERMGITNALVTNETPRKLADHFPLFFDRILVDAPCSGEGMFRKNEEACGEWSLSNVELCASRQDEILDCAAEMLAPGGRLVYSTCTFAPDENEGSMERFLKRHPDFSILKPKRAEGMSAGMPEWSTENSPCLTDTIRLWPHRLHGEGHYMAVLKKAGIHRTACGGATEPKIPEKELRVPGKGCPEFLDFAATELKGTWEGRFLKFGDQLYLMPEGMPPLKGLKVLRPGLHLGTMKKNRFEPSHALALSLCAGDVVHTVDFSVSEIAAYLNGQALSMEGEKGWYLVTVDGYSIGWGKLAGGILKNHYPKGLRK